MNRLLSIIIPCLDDKDIANTVASIHDTAPEAEIVIVNDASTIGIDLEYLRGWPNVVVVENRNRCGSGPSRHIGALYASGEWLMHTDAHMRFWSGWYDEFKNSLPLVGHLQTVFCATMLALETDGSEHGRYFGATLNLLGPDPGTGQPQVFEANWLKDKPEHGDEIPCVMGACYFVQRDWYLYLSPHRFLRSWGKEEEMLSVKTWLAGGKVRYLKTVEVGHVFRGKKDKVPYEIPPAHYLYNKLFCIWTLLPKDLRIKLIEEMAKVEPKVHLERAKALIGQDFHIIKTEMVTMPTEMAFADYCAKFGIKLP